MSKVEVPLKTHFLLPTLSKVLTVLEIEAIF
jgi:hypothetical protein